MTRRGAAWHAALLAGAALAGGAAPHEDGLAFSPPVESPLLLSRSVVRELADGKRIVATRRYRVVFHRDGAGWRLDGELVASEVDAPPALAALATIEKSRSDAGLFPLRLDASGHILPPEQQAVDPAAFEAAKRAALAKAPQAAAFLAALGQAQATGATSSPWPADLFIAGGCRGTRDDVVALPDGSHGTVHIEYESEASEDARMMRSAARTVITEVSGTRRRAREEWTLAGIR